MPRGVKARVLPEMEAVEPPKLSWFSWKLGSRSAVAVKMPGMLKLRM